MPKILLFFIFFSIQLSFSQTFSGVVTDTLNKPLENANVIAKPLQEKAGIKFSIADNRGRYKLELDKEVRYEIKVSYLGYQEEIFIYEPNESPKEHHFKLKATGIALNEVIINHKYEPIVVKKDTLVYDVKAFTTGNERKLKEQLEKLPGVEVDKDGGVTVQGKRVTKFLVENKSFFGGGTKLGVENIPADAVDKVEIIDNFNEVGFLKQVSDSEDLAMNIKLKEDKKKFVFGDVEAGIGNDSYHFLHAALFYYAPKTNLSFIGDSNNIGKQTFTFQDLMRFQGGVSSFISGRKSLTNLYSFATENKDVTENKSQFAALNFSHEVSKKLDVSGFALFSKLFTATKNETALEYLQTETLETRIQDGNNKTMLGLGNVKLDYTPSKDEKWYYNAHFQSSTNDVFSFLNSVTSANQNTFETLRQADNASAKQYLEWHKSISKNHTTTFVVNHSLEKNIPQNQWLTNQPFLAGLIPIEDDESYQITQLKKVKSNAVDVLFKHYWIVNNFNHLYTNIGNNFGTTTLQTSERQLLTDGTVNDFAENGFGNDIDYRLNDAFVGLEYKFKIGKWTNKPGVYGHWYQLEAKQFELHTTHSKFLIQPQFTSEYEFNQSESLKLNYRLVNQFPEASQLASRFTLQSYNSVFRGNALLNNERYHSAMMNYAKMSMYRGLIVNGFVSWNKKVKTIRNTVALDGINQFTTPVLTDNPETNYRVGGSVSKKMYRFNLRLNTSLSWFDYIQEVNGIETANTRTNQTVGVELRTAYKKWPFVKVGYTKGFNSFSGISTSKFETNQFSAQFDHEVFKYVSFKADYEAFTNLNFTNPNTFFEIANVSLTYQKKNSPFGFEFMVSNLLNNETKNQNTFSDFLISEQTTFILPRIFQFIVRYKL
ncbi:carboxypeptidase-like regulatory domain-containing protein [Flavobacterium sp. UBA6135]|uniref:carboxypeptidase-like regulatory domain-containing protein n=1 Tax=Flavobacterium sp. UBA6135 TaxID=1946553 RepID=UPI0025B9A6F0|nr:carboxypeptidase-like regulatory domain-containing protein [Flavobacterium sp. UBA6135]